MAAVELPLPLLDDRDSPARTLTHLYYSQLTSKKPMYSPRALHLSVYEHCFLLYSHQTSAPFREPSLLRTPIICNHATYRLTLLLPPLLTQPIPHITLILSLAHLRWILLSSTNYFHAHTPEDATHTASHSAASLHLSPRHHARDAPATHPVCATPIHHPFSTSLVS